MKDLSKELQVYILSKVHESDCNVNMHIDLWYPSRKWIDYIFSMDAFTFCPHPETRTICTFNSLSQTDSFKTVIITMFCTQEDKEYLQKKIKEKGGDENC